MNIEQLLNDATTKHKFISSSVIPAELPIRGLINFPFAGSTLAGMKNNQKWEPLFCEYNQGSDWAEVLKENAKIVVGLDIDYISPFGYILISSDSSVDNPEGIILVTTSFIQSVDKETAEKHYYRAWVPRAMSGSQKDSLLAELYTQAISYYKNQGYEYSFDYVGGNDVFNFPNTQSMTFVKTKENKFIIVRDYNEEFFSLPGGECDLNEDGKDCAIREAKEEAQVDLQNIELIGTVFVKVRQNGQILSTSTQQRYLAEAVNIKDFVHGLEKIDAINYETVEREEISFDELSKEVKLLKNKTGESILSQLSRLLT